MYGAKVSTQHVLDGSVPAPSEAGQFLAAVRNAKAVAKAGE
jgi:hypothetical protein